MVTIDQVLNQVAAETEYDSRESVEHAVHATIKALGLEVNEQTREVYNPAEGSYTTQPARSPNFAAPRMNNMRLRKR